MEYYGVIARNRKTKNEGVAYVSVFGRDDEGMKCNACILYNNGEREVIYNKRIPYSATNIWDITEDEYINIASDIIDG